MPPSNHNKVCDCICCEYKYTRSFSTILHVLSDIAKNIAQCRLLPQGNQLERSYLPWISLPMLILLAYMYLKVILLHYNFSTGDPALDYIGTGGAAYLPEDSVIPGRC